MGLLGGTRLVGLAGGGQQKRSGLARGCVSALAAVDDGMHSTHSPYLPCVVMTVMVQSLTTTVGSIYRSTA